MYNREVDTRVLADDMHTEAASLMVEHESPKAVDARMPCPINDSGLVSASDDLRSSEDEDESSGCPISEFVPEVTTNCISEVPLSRDGLSSEPKVTTNPVGEVSLFCDAPLSEHKDESAECRLCETEPEATKNSVSVSAIASLESGTFLNESDEETEIESDEESSEDGDDETLGEMILREQTLRTWFNLVEVAEDEEMDDFTRSIAATAADIVEWWRKHTKDSSPSTYHIDFGIGSPIDLIMILALLPERLQSLVCIENEGRSPSGDGENMSWLHEQMTDVLIQLSIDPNPASVHFGQGLASMVRDSVDKAWRTFTERSWLEDQIHLQSHSELEPDQYQFPPDTSKIVFLFNPTEIHWTVVEIDIDESAWTYTLYNSLSQDETGPTWKACHEQLPLLEQLICRASGFAEPATRNFVVASSAQQENAYDCGPIAVYNAVELLEGRKPCTDIDPENLRLSHLELIRDALIVLDGGLETPAFRAYMRKVYLAYLSSASHSD